MKIRTAFVFFFILLFALASVNLVIGFQMEKAQKGVEIAQIEMRQLNEIADELVMSSQWQTRFSRTYVKTKDPRRLDWYKKVNDILNGKINRPQNYDGQYWDLVTGSLTPPPEEKTDNSESIDARFLKHDITPAELNKFNEARNSLAKVNVIEQVAMHAIVGEFDDGTTTFAHKGNPDPELATALLFGEEYYKGNAELSLLVAQLKSMINERYDQAIRQQQEFVNRLLQFNSYLSVGLFSLILFSVLYLQQRFGVRAEQLMQFVRSISSSGLATRTKLTGNDEIGELAVAINGMAENLQSAFEHLDEKISVSEKALSDLVEERARSEKLLHNILPAAIAVRLQGGEETIAEVFPEVTVFFSDIVGFTDLSAKLGPQGTVEMLSTLFGVFDELAEKHQVEKIKTIGDSYMVVGGVPSRDPLHCQHIAEFALDAIQAVEALSSSFSLPIRTRMGIHTGTVAAGVVGKKKFSYDLWGDVVNVASRFESTSTPDKIHVSQAVYIRLADDFTFHHAGTVELKGKGPMESYYLLGKKKDMPKVIKCEKE